MSFSFKVPRVRLFHGLPPPPLPSSLPCRRSWLHIPVAATTHLSRVAFSFSLPQLLAVPPFSMAGTLPSYPRATDYLCLRAKREMKAKLFDTADFPLSLSLFSFSFFSFVSFSLSLSLSFYLSLSLTTSLFYPLSLYIRYISLHLSLSFFPNPFFSFSHPSVTLASPISLSGLHARASFPSYRRAVAILLPPF